MKPKDKSKRAWTERNEHYNSKFKSHKTCVDGLINATINYNQNKTNNLEGIKESKLKEGEYIIPKEYN